MYYRSMKNTLTYEAFREERRALTLRVSTLEEQERKYDSPRTTQKHSEVVADLEAARVRSAEFEAAYPEFLHTVKAEAWSKMRPGRKIEDYPGSAA